MNWDGMALFHWLVHNQDCRLSTTKKSLNSNQTLFLVRGRSGTGDYKWHGLGIQAKCSYSMLH